MKVEFAMNVRRFVRSLRSRVPREVELGLKAGLVEAAETTMTKAKRRTPVDTGALRSSGHVQPPKREGTELHVLFGFGGPAGAGNLGETNDEPVGYAVYVHEDLTARHKVGQAKYLESAVNDMRAKYPDIIRRALARRLRRR